MPPLERIARCLVLDFLAPFNPIESIIYYLNENDEVTCLAAYGTTEPMVGIQVPSSIWRHWIKEKSFPTPSPALNTISWSEDKSQMVVNLNAQGVLIGFLFLRFSDLVEDIDLLNIDAEMACILISLYLAFRFHNMNERSESNVLRHITKNAEVRQESECPHLSDRQLSVLMGLVAKKTNNVIASELGYSVSTVRHETIRIFEILGVSDRVEAAEQAKIFGIV